MEIPKVCKTLLCRFEADPRFYYTKEQVMIKKIIGWFGLWVLVTSLICLNICTGHAAPPFGFMVILAAIICEVIIAGIVALIIFFVKLIKD